MTAFISVLLLSVVAALAAGQLPVCRPHQAAASRISSFPLKADTAGNIVDEVGSGDSSGDGSEVPLYDEFVTAVTPYDLDAEPDVKDKRLCRCEGEDEDVSEFSFDDTDKVVALDSTLKLGFCQPVAETSKIPCMGRRHLLRVIGQLHPSGETTGEVSDTYVSCTCSNGYSRVSIEPWTDGFVFSYRCAL